MNALLMPLVALTCGVIAMCVMLMVIAEKHCVAREKAERRHRTVHWYHGPADQGALTTTRFLREDATWAHEQAIAEKAIKAQIKANLPAIPQCPYCRRYASWCVCVWEEIEN